jgi:hypothetical protein
MHPQLLEMDMEQRQTELLRKLERARRLAEAKQTAGPASVSNSAWSSIGPALHASVVSILMVLGD